jgi:transcriptional regulator with XRE-family HTH domain
MSVQHPLTTYRERQELSQAELAKKLGVDPSTVNRWERWERAPRRRDLPRLSKLTGLPQGAFLGLPEAMER